MPKPELASFLNLNMVCRSSIRSSSSFVLLALSVIERSPLIFLYRKELRSLPHALRVEYESGRLEVVCENAEHNVADVLDTLSVARIKPGRIWAEPPTLNDVFLEITGRELRD